MPRGSSPTAWCSATSATASRATSRRASTRKPTTDVWWRADVPGAEPGRALPLPARRRRRRLRVGERPRPDLARGGGRRRLRGHGRRLRPGLASRVRRLPDLPRPLRLVAASPSSRPAGRSGATGTSCRRDAGGRPRTSSSAATCAGVEQHLDHIESTRREPHLPDAILPGRVDPPLRRDDVRARRPAARRRRALCSRLRRGARARHPHHRRHHARITRATGTSGSSAALRGGRSPSAASTTSTTRSRADTSRGSGIANAAEARLAERRAARALCAGPARATSTSASTAGASTSRTWSAATVTSTSTAKSRGGCASRSATPARRRARPRLPPRPRVRGWHGVMNYSGFLRPLWTWLLRDDPEPEQQRQFWGIPVGRPAARRRRPRSPRCASSGPACRGRRCSTRGTCSTATTRRASERSPARRNGTSSASGCR